MFTVVFFAIIVYASLPIADRLAPRSDRRADGARGRDGRPLPAGRRAATRGGSASAVASFFALIAGIGVSAQWKQWILFTHRVDFGIKDPQFHKDVGFYVFQLPFIQFVVEWLFAGLVIVLIVTAVAHYLNGGIRLQSPFQRVTPQVKAHLSVILALMALVKTAQYYFGRFELNFSSRGVVEGASYTDVNAQLPALNLLIVISVVAARLFIWNIRRRGWVLPIIAVGLWGFVSLVVGTIYPARPEVQGQPERVRRARRSTSSATSRATRDAFNLDNGRRRSQFAVHHAHDREARPSSTDNQQTIDNARLWDPSIIGAHLPDRCRASQTYYQIQRRRRRPLPRSTARRGRC